MSRSIQIIRISFCFVFIFCSAALGWQHKIQLVYRLPVLDFNYLYDWVLNHRAEHWTDLKSFATEKKRLYLSQLSGQQNARLEWLQRQQFELLSIPDRSELFKLAPAYRNLQAEDQMAFKKLVFKSHGMTYLGHTSIRFPEGTFKEESVIGWLPDFSKLDSTHPLISGTDDQRTNFWGSIGPDGTTLNSIPGSFIPADDWAEIIEHPEELNTWTIFVGDDQLQRMINRIDEMENINGSHFQLGTSLAEGAVGFASNGYSCMGGSLEVLKAGGIDLSEYFNLGGSMFVFHAELISAHGHTVNRCASYLTRYSRKTAAS